MAIADNDSVKGKRLMVLGAGVFQVPGIRRAAELGCRVTTLDNNERNIGHRYSFDSINLSTLDVEAVVEAARRLRIDGIVTFASDVAVPTAAVVADQLDLPGCGVELARDMTNKGRFRRLQAANGFSAPRFRVLHSIHGLPREIEALEGPLMFKPVDSSGSRGVTKVEPGEPRAARRAFQHARRSSRSETVCVEEYVRGVEVGIDAFLLDGELVYCGVTRKHMNGFAVTGHSQPPALDNENLSRVRRTVADICRRLGYHSGALNCDVIVTPNDVVCLEMSPRLGGNGLSQVVERALGVDLLGWTVMYALGRRPAAIQQRTSPPRQCGSMVFGANVPGRLENVADEQHVRSRVPEVFEYLCGRKPGDRVEKFTDGGGSLGYVLFDIADGDTYDGICSRVAQALDLRVSSRVRADALGVADGR